MLVRLTILAIAIMMVPATASGAPPAQTGSQAANDPNEKICESIPVIGSRLARKRVCATRAEWDEQKRQDRQAVDQIQKQIGGPCNVSGNKNTGAPSC